MLRRGLSIGASFRRGSVAPASSALSFGDSSSSSPMGLLASGAPEPVVISQRRTAFINTTDVKTKTREEASMAEFSRSTVWIFKKLKQEFDLGFESQFMIVIYLGLVAYVAWWVFKNIFMPYRDQVEMMPFRQRVPLADQHNKFFRIEPALTEGHDPASLAANDADFERPGIVVSERSDIYNNKKTPDGEKVPLHPGDQKTELVVMQQQDFDKDSDNEIFYRSLQYLTTTVAEQKKKTSSTNPLTMLHEPPLPTGGVGDNRIHGMVRCRALTPGNNCVNDAGHIETEAHRKMLLALGPLYMLANPLDQYFPMKFTPEAEIKQNALILGLNTGSLTGYLTRYFPHLRVDVVERDGAVVRLARKYLGFREMPGMNLFLEEHGEFIRRMLISHRNKYDLIFVDCLTDSQGRVPMEYSRLEFLTSLRNSLGRRGVIVANIPNDNDRIFQSTVANWRMAFDGKTVLLIHCATSPSTILMTFADSGERGEPQFGVIKDVEEFKELLRAQVLHFKSRITFDLSGEVGRHNFQQLIPGKRYMFARAPQTAEEHSQKYRDEVTREMPKKGPDDPAWAPTPPKDRAMPKDKEWYGKVMDRAHFPSAVGSHLAHAPKDFEEPKHTGMEATETQPDDPYSQGTRFYK